MTTTIKETKISEWQIQGLQKNSHNGDYFPLTAKDGKTKPRVQLGDSNDPLRIPFGPSQYSENSRLALDFSVKDGDIIKFFRDVDKFVVDWAFKNMDTLFPKRKMTREALEECYCPLITQKSDHDPLIKTKVNSNYIKASYADIAK